MASWVPGIIVALISILPGMLVWRQATQAHTEAKLTREEIKAQQRQAESLDARKVDQAAYAVAESIWKAGMAEAERQAVQAREQTILVERTNARQRRRIDALELALRQAGMPVPPEETP